MMSGEDYKRKLVGMFVDGTPLSGVELGYLYDCGITCNEGLDRGIILTEYGRGFLPESPLVWVPLPGNLDMVNEPPHYTQGGIECIDAIRAALTPEEFRGFCKGNALKYVWREKHKGGDEDMKKAGWYLAKVTV